MLYSTVLPFTHSRTHSVSCQKTLLVLGGEDWDRNTDLIVGGRPLYSLVGARLEKVASCMQRKAVKSIT